MLKFCFQKFNTENNVHKDKVSMFTLVFNTGESIALSLNTRYTEIGKIGGAQSLLLIVYNLFHFPFLPPRAVIRDRIAF